MTGTTDNTAPTSAPAAALVLPEFDKPPADPIALFREWFDTAVERQVQEPGALALATSDTSGRPSNRIISVISITEVGLVFASHSNSGKGREIEANGWASGLVYWRETKQQVQLMGPVVQLTDHKSDELWAGRPPFLHPMSVASHQSEPLDDEETLRAEAERLGRTEGMLPRPAAWVGYQLVPSMVEFWQSSDDRLHRRLRYDHSAEGWTSMRLQP
ncbi:phenazine biosynthesis FMN-dependent oxidase PhzG [Streptomyces sp. N2-109]|uniref:Phenazine biosynthesis FMN-dependent oxidase PhzG n=1 Tax=Streptomyces gossypii TaxID=2883101 RepID=A0ABT2JQW4_9ACTN|nr:phenazine biosynthesis FMN-dependent oxidase PhzG [Streptomyces gossypii]MCT2589750.1 phenazine biosynthesis FMN-dependent oxidase PhzG [Streptomyces gossypii]